MTLKVVEYVDEEGRTWKRGLPETLPDSQAKIGVPLGPPPLDELGLPLDIEVRLHNQLAARGILTEHDARSRLQDIHSALVAALRVDVNTILAVYQGQGAENGTKEFAESEPVSRLVNRRSRRSVA